MKPLRLSLRTDGICIGCLSKLERRRAFSTINGARRHISERHKLPSTPARTRFAPSPTGFLHLGSLRTALYNYLLAKATGGQFLLRLEDTDQKRTVADAEDRLYEDLRWAGLQWDEGPQVEGPKGPYRQSERTELYQQHASKLMASGHAYRCFCSSQRLAELAEQRSKLGLPTDYDRTCASIPASEAEDRVAKGEKFTIRLKVPDKYPDFTDIVYGRIRQRDRPGARRLADAWEDPVLLKSDGFPTYNLANVVDDHLMDITHVVRGTEWMAMTHKHIVMYEAFGWTPPAFAHVPLLTSMDGAKLSKRAGSIDVRSFRESGILPEALVNFVALLGWSIGPGSEVMDLKELSENFTLKFTRGNTAINEKKLDFLQKQHSKRLMEQNPLPETMKSLITRIKDNLEANNLITNELNAIINTRPLQSYIAAIMKVDGLNFRHIDEFVARNYYFFQEPHPVRRQMTDSPQLLLGAADAKVVSDTVLSVLDDHEQGAGKAIEHAIRALAEQSKNEEHDRVSKKQVYGMLRDALAGGKAGVAIKDMITILGTETVRRRLKAYLASY